MSRHEHGDQPRGAPPDTGALTARLHRIEGQVRGIERMLVEERSCIDILTQIAAVTTALDSLALVVLDDHVNHCIADAVAAGDATVAAAKSRDVLDAVERFVRTR